MLDVKIEGGCKLNFSLFHVYLKINLILLPLLLIAGKESV